MGARRAGRIGWQGTASPTILRADFCEPHAAGRGLTALPSGPTRRPAAAGPTCWGVAAATVPRASLWPRRLSNPAIAVPPAFAKATADKLTLFEIHARAL
jgi:hypothetical protein